MSRSKAPAGDGQSGEPPARGGATREAWIALAMSLLESGRPPTDWSLSEFCELAGMSKGSFYSHFRRPHAGFEELHDEVLGRWQARVDLPGLKEDLGAIRDPADRLRLLLKRVLAMPGGPVTMQRWAWASNTAAAALNVAERSFTDHAARAFAELGFTRDEAKALGQLLIRALRSAQGTGDGLGKALDTLLSLARRGTADAGAWHAVQASVPSGAEPGAPVILYYVSAGFPAGAQEELEATVQDFIARRHAPAPAAGAQDAAS